MELERQPHFEKRFAVLVTVLSSMAFLGGCANFSPDAGMFAVQGLTTESIGKDVTRVRTEEDARAVQERVRSLLSREVSVDDAVQIALLNNSGLQAALADLGAAEAQSVEDGLPPSPTISLARLVASGEIEIERQVLSNILGLLTLPRRREIAEDRFAQAQLKAFEQVLRIAAETRRAFYRAIAATQSVKFLEEAKLSAEISSDLAKKLGETGALNKIGQAREHAFTADLDAQLATARLKKSSEREALIRLMGLWGGDLKFRLPGKLQPLPRQPKSAHDIEVSALEKRIDLNIQRAELDLLAKSYGLTRATRFVNALELRGLSRYESKITTDAAGNTEKDKAEWRGIELEFQIPIYDFGEARTRLAEETYMQAAHRLAELAVNIRSEVRVAYTTYRGSYDIARHYQQEVLPLRKIITDETLLQYNGMLFDLSQLLIDARDRISSNIAAIDAQRDFWIAAADLHTAVVGGGVTGGAAESSRPMTAAASGAAH